jgi:pilus assembly protein CpaD
MVSASTEQCGKWTDDLTKTSDNKHYEDFGCSYQNNFAAQIANPADLIGPRNMTEIDAAQRDNVIKDYQTALPVSTSEVDY